MSRLGVAVFYATRSISLWLILFFAACTTQPYRKTEAPQKTRPSQTSPQEDWLPIISPAPKTPGDLRDLPNCAQASFTPPQRGPWESVNSKYLARDEKPNHTSSDHIAYVGEPLQVSVTARYDQQPLQEEWVRLFIHTCSEWAQIGMVKTDQSGQASFPIPKDFKAGLYSLVFQVVGDASTIRTELWIIPEETQIIALELKGALLESAPFDPIDPDLLLSERDPIRGALELTRTYAQKGQLILYITPESDRPDQEISLRGRLRKQGFPLGPLVKLTALKEQSTPTPLELSTLFAADPDLPKQLQAQGVPIKETRHRSDTCRPLGDGQRSGWTRLLHER